MIDYKQKYELIAVKDICLYDIIYILTPDSPMYMMVFIIELFKKVMEYKRSNKEKL